MHRTNPKREAGCRLSLLEFAFHVCACEIGQRQFNRLAFFLALVDGKYQFQSISASICVNIWFAVMLNRIDNIRI